MSVKQGGVLIAGGGQGGPEGVIRKDNITITNNSNDAIQAVAKINQNEAAGATTYLYDWCGTIEEYTAQDIATAHPEWICYIVNDTVGPSISDAVITFTQGGVEKGVITLNQAHNETVEFDAPQVTLNDLNNKADVDLSNISANIDYVIESQLPTSSNGYKWYRKYKSGWVEQGQIQELFSAGTTSITLLVEMKSAAYNIIPLSGINNTLSYSGQTSTGFDLASTIQQYCGWEVKGVAAA